MEFNPNNPIIQLCMQGMAMEEEGNADRASKLFLQAWNEALTEFEKFVAAYYVARHQKNVADKLNWLQTAVQLALGINDSAVRGALPSLYLNIAKCYNDMGDEGNAVKYSQIAASSDVRPTDVGSFYHGTKADLQSGDLLTAGYLSNYKEELVMNHIYFTAQVSGAALAAELAKGEGAARVYIVEPTCDFENDPNVTDKRFPGNPTRSYRTTGPLKITGEVTDWIRLSPEELQKWRHRLANSKGEIMN